MSNTEDIMKLNTMLKKIEHFKLNYILWTKYSGCLVLSMYLDQKRFEKKCFSLNGDKNISHNISKPLFLELREHKISNIPFKYLEGYVNFSYN